MTSASEQLAETRSRSRAALARAKSEVKILAGKTRDKVAQIRENQEMVKAKGAGAAAGIAAGHFLGDYVAKKELEGKPVMTVPFLNVPVPRAFGIGAAAAGALGLLDDEAQNIQLCLVGVGVAAADFALSARLKRLAAGLPAAGGGGAAGP